MPNNKPHLSPAIKLDANLIGRRVSGREGETCDSKTNLSGVATKEDVRQ